MSRESGFTIVEVMLFLGISALMLVGAMAAMNGSIRETRFADARNSLGVYLTSQYNDVRLGVADRGVGIGCGGGAPTDPGASNSCILVGRVLDLLPSAGNKTTINTYPVIAFRCPFVSVPNEADCPSASADPNCPQINSDISAYCPTVPAVSPISTHELEWESELPDQVLGTQPNPAYRTPAGVRSSFNRLAIIHAPLSERVYTYTWSDTAPLGGSAVNIASFFQKTQNQDRPMTFCIESPDFTSLASPRRHFVRFGGDVGGGQIESGEANGTIEGTMRCV